MKLLLIIIGCLGFTLETYAQTTLTLDQCVERALQNNQKLQRATTDTQAATEQRKEAFTKYFPTVSAVGVGFEANKHLVQMDMGVMELNLIKHGVMGNVSLMQPLYAGGQIVNGNKLARVGEDVSKLQRSLTEDEVRLTTETYYWQIVQLKEKLRTIAAVEKQIESVKKDAKAALDAGIRNRNDVLQVQLRQNEMRTSRIQIENALQTVKDLLAQHIGATDSIDIAASSFTAPERPETLYAQPEAALSNTKEHALLTKQVEAEQLNYKLAMGKNMPTVAVGGAYSYHNLLEKSSNRFVGMVTVSVPLTDWWGGAHAIKRQRLKVQNAESTLHDQSEMLVIRMRRAWNDLTDAYKQIGIAQESIDQSEENLRLNTDYYEAGTATISDLLDAQTLYQQAHDRYAEAYTQYEIKKREYLQATGR